MILLEGDKPLGAEAHRYYDEIVRRLEQDKKHVQHIQDFWSDPLTAAGSQSHDQKAAYVQVYLAGNMGSGLANESTEAVRKIVDSVPAPPGIKAYVTGAGPLFADQSHSGRKGRRGRHSCHHPGDRGDAAVRLPIGEHRSDHAGHGVHRVGRGPRCRRDAGQLRDHGAVDLRQQHAGAVWRSPPGRITRSSWSAAITRPVVWARPAKKRSTPCSTAPRTSCWGRA